jgi:hypothetical protein
MPYWRVTQNRLTGGFFRCLEKAINGRIRVYSDGFSTADAQRVLAWGVVVASLIRRDHNVRAAVTCRSSK